MLYYNDKKVFCEYIIKSTIIVIAKNRGRHFWDKFFMHRHSHMQVYILQDCDYFETFWYGIRYTIWCSHPSISWIRLWYILWNFCHRNIRFSSAQRIPHMLHYPGSNSFWTRIFGDGTSASSLSIQTIGNVPSYRYEILLQCTIDDWSPPDPRWEFASMASGRSDDLSATTIPSKQSMMTDR